MQIKMRFLSKKARKNENGQLFRLGSKINFALIGCVVKQYVKEHRQTSFCRLTVQRYCFFESNLGVSFLFL